MSPSLTASSGKIDVEGRATGVAMDEMMM